jgi:tetratricopeptide (TPR) repeat protein
MNYQSLEQHVSQLRQSGNIPEAIEEVQQFIIENSQSEFASQAELLLASLEDDQDAPSPAEAISDPFSAELDIVRSDLELGEVEYAFDGVQRLLREQPDHVEAQTLLREIVQQDGSYREKSEALLEELGLDVVLLSQAAGSQLEADADFSAVQPAGVTAAVATSVEPQSTEDYLFGRYQEAMRLYRSRHHDQAIEIFEDILHNAQQGSQLHQDATEYRQKAEERLLAGEVPLDEIPFEALDRQSQATSAIRLGDYAAAIKLLEDAIRSCRSEGVRYPPEWNRQFQTAREIQMAHDTVAQGDEALNRDNLEQARMHWMNAQKVLADPDLEEKLRDLEQARVAVIDGEILAKSLIGQSNEQQIQKLIVTMDRLRAALAKFPQVSVIETTYSTLEERAFRIKDELNIQGESYLREAEQATKLADRRRWLESGQAVFELMQALSGETTPNSNFNKTRQMLSEQTGYEDKLREANMLLHQDVDAGDLAIVFSNLRDVKDVVVDDPDIRTLSRKLRDKYLDQAERILNDPGGLTKTTLRQAEDYIRLADDPFFGTPSPRLDSQKSRLYSEKRSRRLKNRILLILAIIVATLILIPIIYFTNVRIVQPVIAPTATSTATATSTLTPTATPTLTPTSTPAATDTPTSTATPTATITPVVLYGSIIFQVWVYEEPSDQSQRIGFVLQNQPVEVVGVADNSQGEEWFKIRWRNRSITNEGWIQSDQVAVSGTN